MEKNGNACEADGADGCCSALHSGVRSSICERATATRTADVARAASLARGDQTAQSAGQGEEAASDADTIQAAERTHRMTGGEPATEATAGRKALTSVLRSSIARYGSNSYYYAHAGLPGAAENVSKSAKVSEAPGVVTGGPPILLGRSGGGEDGGASAAAASDALLLSAAEAADTAIAGKRLTGFTILQSYLWADDGPRVRVYVPLEKLPETPKEKELDPCLESKSVAATFKEESAALVIHRKAKRYLLHLNKLYFPVKPSESRVSIRSDRVTLTLVKEDENLTWFSLMKSA